MRICRCISWLLCQYQSPVAVVLVWVVELPLQEATLALVLVWVACGVEEVEVLRNLSVVTSMMITVARLIMITVARLM